MPSPAPRLRNATRAHTPRATTPRMAPAVAPLGVYVHFPWCLSKCPYCDFVVHARPASVDRPRRLRRRGARRARRAHAWGSRGRLLTSIFFGGGTPSLWDAARSSVACSKRSSERSSGTAARSRSASNAIPARSTTTSRAALVDVGVEPPQHRRAGARRRAAPLSRPHPHARGRDRRGPRARSAGVPRVSTDLMYAVADRVARGRGHGSDATLADLGATHVSAYSLTIEPRDPFGELARRGRLPLCRRRGHGASRSSPSTRRSSGAGLEHYEVSNYAKPGAAIAPQPRLLARARLPRARVRRVRHAAHRRSGARYRNQPHAARPTSRAHASRRRRGGPFSSQVHGLRRAARRRRARLRERIMLGLAHERRVRPRSGRPRSRRGALPGGASRRARTHSKRAAASAVREIAHHRAA